MLTVPLQGRDPRLFLLGIDCNFTNHVVKELIAAGVKFSAIGLPGMPNSPVPLKSRALPATLPLAGGGAEEQSVLSIAQKAAIPVYRFGSLTSSQAISTIQALNSDLLLSVCYPRLIPQRTTRLFPHGALNVHPSPLPQLRGPDPLFWIFRNGMGHTALTIHKLSSSLDGGAIVAQQEISIADGISESVLEAQLARPAAKMLTDIAHAIQRGDALQGTPQDDSRVTYAPFPDDNDFRLSSEMSARTAFNFVRGVEERGVPITVEFNGKHQSVIEAIGYHATEVSSEGSTALPFRDGYLEARLGPRY